jgi:hypothetical protein
MLVLSFTPAPFSHASGREVWPEIRDSAQETVRSLRNEVRHLIHHR